MTGFFDLLGLLLLMQRWMSLTFCCKDALLTHAQLPVDGNPQVLQSCQLSSQSTACNGIPCPKYRTYLSLLNCLQFLQSFWMVALPCHLSDIPPSLVSYMMLLRVLIFNHQSLVKLLNSFSIDPWGTSYVNKPFLVFELLITVIWVQHSRQYFFLQAVLQSSPYFPHLVTGIPEEAVLKALLKSR